MSTAFAAATTAAAAAAAQAKGTTSATTTPKGTMTKVSSTTTVAISEKATSAMTTATTTAMTTSMGIAMTATPATPPATIPTATATTTTTNAVGIIEASATVAAPAALTAILTTTTSTSLATTASTAPQTPSSSLTQSSEAPSLSTKDNEIMDSSIVFDTICASVSNIETSISDDRTDQTDQSLARSTNDISAFPRPIGGYKYTMEFLYSVGRDMTGVTMNIPTPTSITPRSLRSSPPTPSSQAVPPLLPNLPPGAGSASSGSSSSTRYGNMPTNSYIFQAYVPTGSQRRLWHSDNSMWQYDRNYPYNQPFAPPYGIPSLMPLGYDGQYGAQRFVYPNYYPHTNYQHGTRPSSAHHHQQQQQQQHQLQQQQPHQQQQQPSLVHCLPQNALPSGANANANALVVPTTSSTLLTQSEPTQTYMAQPDAVNQEIQFEKQQQQQQQQQLTSQLPQLEARSNQSQQQQQQSNTVWRFNARIGNRDRYGTGRTLLSPAIPTAVAANGQFCESQYYYNSGGRHKPVDAARSTQRFPNMQGAAASINTSDYSNNNNNNNNNNCSNQINHKTENDSNGDKANRNAGKVVNYAKRSKKSAKNKGSNSSRSQSSSSHGSGIRSKRSSDDSNSKPNASTKLENVRNCSNTAAIGSNFRPYPNRSYRNRMRYNADTESQNQQPQQIQQTQPHQSIASTSRTNFHGRHQKFIEQRPNAFRTPMSGSESGTVDHRVKNQYTRYYHSRQNEFTTFRNYLNYTNASCTYSCVNAQDGLMEERDEYGQVSTASKMTSCDIESFVLKPDQTGRRGGSTSVASSDGGSDGTTSYRSQNQPSSNTSRESSLSKNSIISMVRAITYSCVAMATGTEMPNLSGPNLVPYGDMTLLQDSEDSIRLQNGYKHSVNMELSSNEAAAIARMCISSSETTSAASVSSADREDAGDGGDHASSQSMTIPGGNSSRSDSPTVAEYRSLEEKNKLEQKHQARDNLAFLHELYGFTPADRFLARAHLVETKRAPPNLLNKSRWDPLTQSVWNKFMETQQTEKVYKLKMRLWRYIYVLMMAKHPRYGLYLVGSSISNFGANGSDIDMCMLACTNPSIDPRMEAVYHLQLMRDCLIQTTEFEEFNLIEARVPILRFMDRQHKVEVDINFNNSVGIRNTHLLYCYSQLEWRLRPLVMVVKQWAQYHNINNAKTMTISSYSLVLMVIHFLQFGVQPPVLPCLHKMYPEKFSLLRSNDFGYVDMNEEMEPYESNNKQPIGELIVEFLRYYTFFEYSKYAISIRVGGVLPIEACRVAKATKNDVHQWNELCIEEPFDQTNTARSVYDADTFDRIKTIIATSWRLLEQTHNLNSIFEDYVGPTVITPIDSEGDSDFLSVVDESSSSGELLYQKTRIKSLSARGKQRPRMVDKSVVALIKDDDNEPCINVSSAQAKATDAALTNDTAKVQSNTEVATNRTKTTESVAEPLESFGRNTNT